jgi:outer membrane protein TolC
MRKLLLSILICNLSSSISAQVLTAEDAVTLALKNNYDILVARNDADIAKANNTSGNAGMLPTFGINASDNYTINNLEQKLTNGSEIKATNAGGNNFNAAAVINWTLFDGGKMFITKKKLNQIQDLGELQFKDKVMQNVNDVIVAYYDIVRQQQQLLSILQVINYNTERVKIFESRFNAGLSAKTDLLQAKVDLNVNKETAITQQTAILNTKRKLNQLLSRETETVFEVTDSIPLTFQPNKNEILQTINAQNPTLLATQKQIEIAKYGVQELKSLYLPKLSVSAAYAFARSDNKAGFTLFSQTYGPQFGGALSIPLYQAGNVKRQVAVAKIQVKSAEYNLEKVKLQTANQVQTALSDFENQQQLLTLEKENTLLAKENLEISLARLRLGQTNSLEARQAETSYQSALARLSNFQFNLKAAETKLRQLLAAL